ncbi:MAG TPA: molybdate ABC transporter substrate-binding protein [Dehalococcoidia bacterium]|nr:molybdate ABC transporter substrate-binding protein [Dehalococcoidia bacterium]
MPVVMALLLTAACAYQPDAASGNGSRELTVFAAASLFNAFPEIADAFVAEHPGASVTFNFAGSQRLRTQLDFGARADVFASADRRQMDLAVEAGVIAGNPAPFAGNSLVVIVPLPGGPTGANSAVNIQRLEDLASDGVKLALALPDVPAGRYALTLLRNLETQYPALGPGYASRVMDNVVTLEPNVRGVLQKVALGEVDAGIVYRTDAATEYAAEKVQVVSIPQGSNIAAEYPIAVLRDAANPGLAKEFARFLLGERAQAILKSYGFKRPAQIQSPSGSNQR